MGCTSEQFRLTTGRFPASVCVVATGEAPNRGAGFPMLAVSSARLLTFPSASMPRPAPAGQFARSGHQYVDERAARRQGDNLAPVLVDAMVSRGFRLVSTQGGEHQVVLVGAVLHLPEKDHPDVLFYRRGAFDRWGHARGAGRRASVNTARYGTRAIGRI